MRSNGSGMLYQNLQQIQEDSTSKQKQQKKNKTNINLL